MAVEIRILGSGDQGALANVAPEVFDNQINKRWSAEFLADPRHHLAVATEGELVVGFASAVHYVHPDKPPELWINEVGVAPTHQKRGLGKRLLRKLFEVGRECGCGTAWVLTDRLNVSAMRLYASSGGIAARNDQVMFEFRLDQGDAS
ncbi:MAG: GNAT family N-acetyltransferase [Thermoanaerobaculia bacterium]